MLDKNTFGDSPANITLAKILNEIDNPNLSKHISKLASQCNSRAKQLASCLDMGKATKKDRQFWYKLLRVDCLTRIDSSPNIAEYPEVRSYLLNTLFKSLREKILQI